MSDDSEKKGVGKKDEKKKKVLLPEPTSGIEVNFCKNPACDNFGVPPSRVRHRGPGAGKRNTDDYIIVANRGKSPALKCIKCGESTTIKSNLGAHEEFIRCSAYLDDHQNEQTCPNSDCPNHNIDVSAGRKFYRPYGSTKSGSKRYRCRICGKTLSVKQKALSRQRRSHVNIGILDDLTNGVKLNRIIKRKKIHRRTIYHKIDFLHGRCVAFIANREGKIVDALRAAARERARIIEDEALAEGREIFVDRKTKLYIGVDRSDHYVNWTNRSDKRNIRFQLVASVENFSGYVLAAHLNFDPSLNPSTVEAEALTLGDHSIRKPFRRHARVWLEADYLERITLQETVGLVYRASGEIVADEDDEDAEQLDANTRLPKKGMQIHNEYTLLGHFLHLRNMLTGVDKLRFFLDRDSGMSAACISVFSAEIREKRCDAFFVKINKACNSHDKLVKWQDCRTDLREFAGLPPKAKLTAREERKIALAMVKQRLHFPSKAKRDQRWVTHPLPNMGEPEKQVCWLTQLKEDPYDEDHVARLHLKGSLHAVDNFFQRLRRGVSLFDRPATTASNPGRKWYGNNAYSPTVLAKMLDIYRVVYNFVETGEDGMTPAMRLGLAKAPLEFEDIIYFVE